jgi:N utilization substance protein B
MAIPQKKMREIVFQLLYSSERGYSDEQDLIELIMKELAVTKSIVRQALEKVYLIQNHKSEIDAAISKTSQSYTFDRIQSVEINILRLAVYELLIESITPPKVIIAEAMRLARKFGTPESASFINAILDNMYKSQQGETASPESIQIKLLEMEKKEKLSQIGFETREKEKNSDLK